MNRRPRTLSEIAELSESLEDFGRYLRDWLHELRTFSSRPQIEAAIRDEPRWLRRQFARGEVADAWLAAYAEYVANRAGCVVPNWTASKKRISPDPWFATETDDVGTRIAYLRDSPAPFKRRNLFTPSVELPLSLRPGRPTKTVDEKRRTNAERQRRFRERRSKEWKRLLRLTRAYRR